MLDCPDANHTSPTRTSLIAIDCVPETTVNVAPLASAAPLGIEARHRPFLVGRSCRRLVLERYRDFGTGVSCAPNGDSTVTLKHHVFAEEARNGQFPQRTQRSHQNEQQHQDWNSHRLTFVTSVSESADSLRAFTARSDMIIVNDPPSQGIASIVIPQPNLCVIGDTHGHLQLALCVAARWQQALDATFDAVFLCGDVGTFTSDSQLDSTTRRHAKTNPCELEFLHQWSVAPQPRWLAKIFAPRDVGGLGLECPVVMVHGNHEGFSHLANLVSDDLPTAPVAIIDLPHVDTGGFIQYLPSGWKCRTRSDLIVAGVGGIERGQRQARYHDLAYLDELAILNLLETGPFDVMVSHQGPSTTQGNHGSQLLDAVLNEGLCRCWFHGHSTPHPAIVQCGRNDTTTVVPLRDVAFPMKGLVTDEPGDDGWCRVIFGETMDITRERPSFWREFRRRKWRELASGQLIAPPIADVV